MPYPLRPGASFATLTRRAVLCHEFLCGNSEKTGGAFEVLGIPIPALILFCCAAAMVLMAARRFRAGQRGRALFNLMLAAFMAIFAWGHLG